MSAGDPFELENRYVVVKRRDLDDAVISLADWRAFNRVIRAADLARAKRGATSPLPFTIVIERDWPEYDAVLQMLKERCEREEIENASR